MINVQVNHTLPTTCLMPAESLKNLVPNMFLKFSAWNSHDHYTGCEGEAVGFEEVKTWEWWNDAEFIPDLHTITAAYSHP